MSVDVKIGIENSARELTLTSSDTAVSIQETVDAALTGEVAILSLTDDKGTRFSVPSPKISYVEISNTEGRRVGFGS